MDFLPKPGSPDELRIRLETDLGKWLLCILNPPVGGTVVLAHDLVKTLIEFRQAKKESQALEFMSYLHLSIQRLRNAVEKLKPAEHPAVEVEAFAGVFMDHLEQSFQDDEREKARYYAAFAASELVLAPPLESAERAILFDAISRLRAHDLSTLLALHLTQENRLEKPEHIVPRGKIWSANMVIKVARASRITGIVEGLVSHSLAVLVGTGLAWAETMHGVVGSDFRAGGYGLHPQGAKLASIIRAGLVEPEALTTVSPS